MKKSQLLSFVLLTCMFQIGYSQNTEEKEVPKSKTQKKIEEVENKVNETNETVSQTGEAVKSSINTTKETVGEVKDAFTDIFGKKTKNTFAIAILQTDLSNSSVNQLSEYITKKKPFKNFSKSFKSGKVSISIVPKKNQLVWDEIPQNIKNLFTILEMDDKKLVLQVKNTTAPTQKQPK